MKDALSWIYSEQILSKINSSREYSCKNIALCLGFNLNIIDFKTYSEEYIRGHFYFNVVCMNQVDSQLKY